MTKSESSVSNSGGSSGMPNFKRLSVAIQQQW